MINKIEYFYLLIDTIYMPSLSQLQYIVKLSEIRHFGDTARALGVSQPTLSMQIAKAEEEFGSQIFDRRALPVGLTPLGEILIDGAREVLLSYDALLKKVGQRDKELQGDFSLALIPTLAPYILPWFIQDFALKYPKLKLAVSEKNTEEILEGLSNRSLDAGILATPVSEKSVTERVLFYDPFYLYAHRSEPVLSRKRLRVADLDPRRIWLLEDGHCVRVQVSNFCRLSEALHFGSVKFAGGSFETLVNLIDASEGYTLIPESFARTLAPSVRQKQVRAFWGAEPVREVSLVHHQRHWQERAIDALFSSIEGRIPRGLKQHKGEVLSIFEQDLAEL